MFELLNVVPVKWRNRLGGLRAWRSTTRFRSHSLQQLGDRFLFYTTFRHQHSAHVVTWYVREHFSHLCDVLFCDLNGWLRDDLRVVFVVKVNGSVTKLKSRHIVRLVAPAARVRRKRAGPAGPSRGARRPLRASRRASSRVGGTSWGQAV